METNFVSLNLCLFQSQKWNYSSNSLRLQNETLDKGRGKHTKYLPYAFTEQGLAMLSGILNSDKAIDVNNSNHEGLCNDQAICIDLQGANR